MEDFSSKGMFGPEGFLATLDSCQQMEFQPAENVDTTSAAPGESNVPLENASTSDFNQPTNDNESYNDSCPVKKMRFSCSTDQNLPSLKNTDPNLKSVIGRPSPGPPEEAVFLLDHIIEFIFSALDQADLQNCRLVSHRWAYFGCKELQNSMSIKFKQCIGTKIVKPGNLISGNGNIHTGNGNIHLGNGNMNSGSRNINLGNANVNSGNNNINLGNGNVNSGNGNINFGNGNTNSGNRNIYLGNGNVNSGNDNKHSGNGNINSGHRNMLVENLGLGFVYLRNPFEKQLSVDNLTSIMNSPISGEFPCASFEFNGGYLADAMTQRFFNSHGDKIKTIKLGGLPGFNIIFEDLKKLVLCQAISLQVLELFGNVVLKRYLDSADSDSDSEETEPDAGTLPQEGGALLLEVPTTSQPGEAAEPTSNFKLKVIRISSGMSKTVFQKLLRFSPNLQQVDLNCEKLHYLLEPTNRLHLLKHLVIDADEETISCLELITKEINSNTNMSPVVTLHGLTVKVYRIIRQPHMWSRVTKVINTCLTRGSSSIKKLVWDQMRFLEGLKMPENMPKVKELVLYNRNYHPLNPTQYFPVGLSLQNMFPKLRCVRIVNVNANAGGLSSVERFFDNCEPVTSVKVLSVENFIGDLAIFRDMFPNARINYTM